MSRLSAIKLTLPEITSGLDRQRLAEQLIRQLPADHDGRNTWLLNYGEGGEAQGLREIVGISWDHDMRAARPILTAPARMRLSQTPVH